MQHKLTNSRRVLRRANQHRKMYTKATTDDVLEVDIPMLLLIPTGLVEWLSSARHTPWELRKKLMETVTEAGLQDTPESVRMSLAWCLKAGKIKCGARGSNTMDPSGVFTQDPAINAWLKQRLNSTLGIEEAPPQQIWSCPQPMPPPQVFTSAPPGPTQPRDKVFFAPTGMAAISG